MNSSACVIVGLIMHAAARFAAALILLSACDPKLADDEPCADLVEFGCEIVECIEADGELRCTFDMYAEPGNEVDIAIELPGGGALDWNGWPWNADAGELEDLNLEGDGAMCGEFSLDIRGALERGYRRPNMVTLVCGDWTAGVFATSSWPL